MFAIFQFCYCTFDDDLFEIVLDKIYNNSAIIVYFYMLSTEHSKQKVDKQKSNFTFN